MKIYVSSSSQERVHRAIPITHRLRLAGHETTHREGDEHQLDAKYNIECIRHSDVFWILSSSNCAGAWAELGAALMAGVRTVISGKERTGNAYARICAESYETDEEAFVAITGVRAAGS